jgi:hypothetical protein
MARRGVVLLAGLSLVSTLNGNENKSRNTRYNWQERWKALRGEAASSLVDGEKLRSLFLSLDMNDQPQWHIILGKACNSKTANAMGRIFKVPMTYHPSYIKPPPIFTSNTLNTTSPWTPTNREPKGEPVANMKSTPEATTDRCEGRHVEGW